MPFTELGLVGRDPTEASVDVLRQRIVDLEELISSRGEWERVIVRAAGVTTAVDTTDTDLVELSLPIPTNWNTWDLDVQWACRFTDSSGGNTGVSTTVTVSIELDGVTMPGTQNLEVTDVNTNDVNTVAGIGWAEARTVTGTRTVTLVASRAGAPTMNALGIRLRAEATRLT